MHAVLRGVKALSPSMFSARKKIAKEKGADPDTFEESVAQVIHHLSLL